MRVERVPLALELVGLPDVVGVTVGDVVAAGLAEAAVEGVGVAVVGLLDDPDLAAKALEYIWGAVGRAVVEDEYFVRRTRLGEDRGEGLTDVGLGVVDPHGRADRRRLHDCV